MEKMLIGGISIGFDTDIFIKNNNNQKQVYKIKNKESGLIEKKRIVTKILKMEENNQYGTQWQNRCRLVVLKSQRSPQPIERTTTYL